MSSLEENKRNWIEYDTLNTVFLKNGESFMVSSAMEFDDALHYALTKKEMVRIDDVVWRIVVESEETQELKVHYVPDEATVSINLSEIIRVEPGDAILERATICQPYALNRAKRSWKYGED